ncbi:hypothetical protein LEP1GSC202_0638 [Leptospira yanagawae serovar Saopaulo str. Sao Paulo = ATCC 700523]|uniref:Uncharacterized protein n=1 Tax=Leptospira yanagawae serovar Saopaulo str. Sao Paulo = ATCC 700523 TaxID=1249483 RepID=A0A5E8HJZ1_9LEPT|nr:hypothetical protein [Leptospira yanagawae]EOQ90136.1 hypothetical protein LEP1GSC202_0638 [Leptospira yanagawae serovar Saopaulo str. Sao Paulo = ATCC 700523]
MSLFTYKKRFLELHVPKEEPTGDYQISWIGPKWFQWSAKTGLQFLHFRHWWGKSFQGKMEAINLFQNPKDLSFSQKYKMQISFEISCLDGKPSLFLRYTKEAPFPWPYFVDEFRVLNDKELLGLSYPKFAPFLGLPFLIRKQDSK